jgi:hypothetical protein
MPRKVSWLFAGLLLSLAFASTAQQTTPGLVLMTTSSIEPTAWEGSFLEDTFTKDLPETSDEILDARIVLRGRPLETISGNPSVFWPADTLVELKQGASFQSGPPQARMVRTQVRAISLVGAEPITVTYGGTNPELWDVRVCQSHAPVPLGFTDGFMTLTNGCATAGTFVHTMLVFPKFIFTRQRDGRTVVLDQGTGTGQLTVIGRGFWTLREFATGDFASAPAGAVIDADCDGSLQNDVTLPGTSNVLLGLARVNCNAADPNHGYEAIRPILNERKDTFVLEPATQDDRILLINQSALPSDANPLAAGGLGALALVGLGMTVIGPNGRR